MKPAGGLINISARLLLWARQRASRICLSGLLRASSIGKTLKLTHLFVHIISHFSDDSRPVAIELFRGSGKVLMDLLFFHLFKFARFTETICFNCNVNSFHSMMMMMILI